MGRMIDHNSPRPLCPKCGHQYYDLHSEADGRPKFICQACKHTWTRGLDGGVYAMYARPIKS